MDLHKLSNLNGDHLMPKLLWLEDRRGCMESLHTLASIGVVLYPEHGV
jgi:hypothetical protein